MEWREDNGDRQLENILTYIAVYYIDADNNNYHLAFQLTNGKFTTDGPERNDRQTNSYACSTPLDLAAIDFDYLQKIGERADALVMSDEEGKTLTLKSAGMFRFRVWPVSLSNVDRWNRSEEYRAESQQMQVQFELNYVDKSESPEYQGRFTVTNYYTVAFTADAAGRLPSTISEAKMGLLGGAPPTAERTPDDSLRPESPHLLRSMAFGLRLLCPKYARRMLQRATIWPCAASM